MREESTVLVYGWSKESESRCSFGLWPTAQDSLIFFTILAQKLLIIAKNSIYRHVGCLIYLDIPHLGDTSLPCWVYAERIEWFIEDQAFSPSYDLTPSPPPPPLMSVSSIGGTQEDRERETTCWREGGGGGAGAKSYEPKFGGMLGRVAETITEYGCTHGAQINVWDLTQFNLSVL